MAAISYRDNAEDVYQLTIENIVEQDISHFSNNVIKYAPNSQDRNIFQRGEKR